MKNLFKSRRFKLITIILSLLLVGALICAANGNSETAQSSVVGIVPPKFQTEYPMFSERQAEMQNI